MKRATLEAVVAARAAKRPVVVLTPLGGAETRVWSPAEGDLPADLREAAARALATDDASTAETAAGPVFVRPVNPPPQLVILPPPHIPHPLPPTPPLLP